MGEPGATAAGNKAIADIADEAMNTQVQRDTWREAYLALRAYTSNNNGANARRYRAAKDQLKKLRLR